jgi:citrate synthase
MSGWVFSQPPGEDRAVSTRRRGTRPQPLSARPRVCVFPTDRRDPITTGGRGGLEDVVVGDSSISLVDGDAGRLLYRGYDVAEVAERLSYEGVFELLVTGEAPALDPPEELVRSLARRRRPGPGALRVVDALPRAVPPMDAFRTSLSSLGDGLFPYPPTLEQGLDLLAQAPTLLARYVRHSAGLDPVEPTEDLGHVEHFLYLLEGRRPEPERVRALERYFVLVADHGMNASTFTLRVVLSTQSDLISAAVAAVGALKGPAHGGAPARVLDMLDRVGTAARAEGWIDEALARGERIMGMGHRVYKVEDPRAERLREIAREVAAPERFELALAVERAALRALRRARPHVPLYTNVEFYAAVVMEAVGLPRELFAPTFALARTAGWVAHALEQAADNRLIRPDVRYTGSAPRRLPDLSERRRGSAEPMTTPTT